MSETSAQGGRNICVLVDMDMVICDFETHLLAEFRTRHPTLRFIPLEKRMGFSVKEQYRRDISNDAAIHKCALRSFTFRPLIDLDPLSRPTRKQKFSEKEKIAEIFNSKNFFLNLPEIPGGCEALKEMNGLAGVDVKICSRPMESNEFCEAEKKMWVEIHLGKDWVDKLLLVSDKTEVNGHLLIDDKTSIKGKNKNPVWEHVVFTACHNKHEDIGGKRRLNGWTENWKDLVLECQAG